MQVACANSVLSLCISVEKRPPCESLVGTYAHCKSKVIRHQNRVLLVNDCNMRHLKTNSSSPCLCSFSLMISIVLFAASYWRFMTFAHCRLCSGYFPRKRIARCFPHSTASFGHMSLEICIFGALSAPLTLGACREPISTACVCALCRGRWLLNRRLTASQPTRAEATVYRRAKRD